MQVQAQKDSKVLIGNNSFPSWVRCVVYHEANTEEKTPEAQILLELPKS